MCHVSFDQLHFHFLLTKHRSKMIHFFRGFHCRILCFFFLFQFNISAFNNYTHGVCWIFGFVFLKSDCFLCFEFVLIILCLKSFISVREGTSFLFHFFRSKHRSILQLPFFYTFRVVSNSDIEHCLCILFRFFFLLIISSH